MQVKQVSPHRHFPSGDSRPIAVLKFSPEEIALRFGLLPEEDFDSFDFYQLAAFEDANVGQIWLLRYRNSPDPGTNVLVDSSVDIKEALQAVTRALELEQNDLTWVHENIAQ